MPDNEVSPPSLTIDDKLNPLIDDWSVRLKNAQIGHYKCSERLYLLANVTGFLLILTTTLVTALLFFDTNGPNEDKWQLLLFILSVTSAALASIVSFVRFAERAELHRSAASRYGKLRRQLEFLNTYRNTQQDSQVKEKLKLLRIEWEYVSSDAPLTPKSAIPTEHHDKK
ncbi:SLATT domain-containing protein [Vibrio splendidus]|uniref:SLATT domain-containing protein n=1 Tax=Vibrio sp. 10N.222.52.C12 TaxID=3229630 RepID=UPI00354EAAD3